MKRLRFNRRTPLVVLILLVAFALVLGSLYAAPQESASADTFITVFPSLTVSSLVPVWLVASNFSPANNATGVALNANISVKFNRDLNPATIQDPDNFTVERLLAPPISGTISYSTATDTAVFNPTNNLLPETTYFVTLTNDIKTPGGMTFLVDEVTWSFTTDDAPEIVNRTPAPGATNVPVDMEIHVTFDKKMLDSFGVNSVTLKKVGEPQSYGVTCSLTADDKTLIVQPMGTLQENTTYEVTLSNTIKSQTLVPLAAPVSWQFTTTAAAPTVTAKSPAASATGVPVNQVIAATFSKAMDASTLTSATFYVAKQGGSPLPANVTYSAATKTASLDPVANLEEGATYVVTLSNAVKGDNGLVLAGAPVTWTFSTAAGAPVLVSTVPANGTTGVPVGQIVSATFDKAMNASTLTSATFYIAKSGGSPLPANVTYSAATKTASLDPLADLEAGATYNVTLSNAVQSEAGQALAGAPQTWSFTTAAGGGGGGGGSSSFTDVIPGVTPYSTAIAALSAEGIITGFEDGTFRPNQFVTRQQFAKMIVLTLGIPVTGSEVCPFVDVVLQTGTDPFYPSKYVAVCAARGITQGKTATLFAPYENITHQQLITMIARAASLGEPPATFTPTFTAAQFSLADHYSNARKAAYAGLLNGLLGVGPTYSFFAGSTRGECAQLLYNLMNLIS